MHRLPCLLMRRQLHVLSRSSRTPRWARAQLHYRANAENVRTQTVRLKKPPFLSIRRLATFGAYSAIGVIYLSLFLRYLDVEVEILDEELGEEQRHNGGEEQESEHEDEEGPFYAEEDSMFIPLTWSKKIPRTFYRGSDPEWQEFLKVAKDKSKRQRIMEELVQIVFAGSAQHPFISRQLGKNPTAGKYWLDITFPDGPPPEYERSGIEIGDEFVAWSQQRVSQEQQWRLTRTLWPSAAASGLWAATKTLAGLQFRRVKQALGFEDKDPFSPEEKYRHMIEMMQKQQRPRERKGVGNAQTEPEGSPGSADAPSAQESDSKQNPPSESQKRLPWHIPIHLPGGSGTGEGSSSTDLPIAMHVFNHTLSKSWSPKKAEPPRGSFVVQGLIEVRGERGRMMFDVQSAYDPRQSKYVQISAGVRNFKQWKQTPKGGP